MTSELTFTPVGLRAECARRFRCEQRCDWMPAAPPGRTRRICDISDDLEFVSHEEGVKVMCNVPDVR